MASLFPLFLRLEGRRCLLVGAGNIAAQKIDSLLSAGAAVHIVAPSAGNKIGALIREGRVCWSQRAFRSSDLDGAVLVIAATGDRVVNETIFREARGRGVLCNAVDEPERCDFYYPAVVRRGDLQIAISTAGHSPALAQRIRKDLEIRFSQDYAEWLSWLGEVRARLFLKPIDPERRKRTLHRLASAKVYDRFVATRRKKAGQR